MAAPSPLRNRLREIGLRCEGAARILDFVRNGA
jgi:hypothetical protein